MNQPHAICRYFGKDDVMLYVAMTRDPEMHFERISSKFAWAPEIARQGVQWFENRESAKLARRRAAALEGPKYNRNNSGDVMRHLLACAESGMTARGTARELGIPYHMAYNTAERLGFSFRRQRHPEGHLLSRVKEMRKRGNSVSEMAKETGTTPNSIRAMVSRIRKLERG